MKDNNTCINSRLSTSKYQDFAAYLRNAATAPGLELYAVSIANEPNATHSWRGCLWSSSEIATFLRYYLAPTFAGLNTQVIGGSDWWTVPIAFSSGGGSFTETNNTID